MLVYIIIIVFSNIYDGDNVEEITQIYKNDILVYSSFLLFCRLISAHKVTKTHKNIFHHVF
jgi:hypothetical protein